MKHTIEIEGLPEGWEPVAFRIPQENENYFEWGQVTNCIGIVPSGRLIIRKKQRRDLFDPLRFAEGLIEQLPDNHEGAINWLMNNGDGDKADNLRKKYRHKQPRRILLEETGEYCNEFVTQEIESKGMKLRLISAEKIWREVKETDLSLHNADDKDSLRLSVDECRKLLCNLDKDVMRKLHQFLKAK